MIRALKLYDPLLFALALLATLLGVFFIFDAGYARSVQNGAGSLPREFRQQILLVVLSVPLFMICSWIRAETWRKGSKIIWVLSLLMLLAVKVVGVEQNGAKRWIDLGPFNIQPSEFIKVAAIVYLAAVFADRKAWPKIAPRKMSRAMWVDNVLLPRMSRWMPGVWVLVSVIIIEKEPDLGTAAVVGTIAFCMFLLGGANRKTLAIGAAVAVLGVTWMVHQQPYRVDRITNHVQRWDPKNVDEMGYQTVQSELAMATGGITGVGVGAGRVKHLIPAPTTDFIMATIAEEFGLVGALSVLALLGAVCFRLLMLARRAQTDFARLVLSGTACWLGIQTCVNYMMANGFLPAIGIPLPFISSGGSCLIALWMVLGICNSVLAPAADPARVTRRVARPPLATARGRG